MKKHNINSILSILLPKLFICSLIIAVFFSMPFPTLSSTVTSFTSHSYQHSSIAMQDNTSIQQCMHHQNNDDSSMHDDCQMSMLSSCFTCTICIAIPNNLTLFRLSSQYALIPQSKLDDWYFLAFSPDLRPPIFIA